MKTIIRNVGAALAAAGISAAVLGCATLGMAKTITSVSANKEIFSRGSAGAGTVSLTDAAASTPPTITTVHGTQAIAASGAGSDSIVGNAFSGDANLDGVINGSDFSILAANFDQGASDWDNGNFLFAPPVGGSNFAALAANFAGDSTNVPEANAAALDAFENANNVPEPGCAAAAICGLGVLGARRGRGRSL